MNTTITINLDTFSSNGIKALLDVANDCWASTQGIYMSADYGYITDEEADKQIFDCCKQAVEFIKLAQILDKSMKIQEHNLEEKKMAALQNKKPCYCKGIMEYEHRCYLQYAINEYNNSAEVYGCEHFESPWSEEDITNNYDAHWTEVTDDTFGECKQHLEEPNENVPAYLSEDIVIENLGAVKFEDIVINDKYTVVIDAEAEDCYYWINNPESAENLGFTVVDNDTFTLFSKGITKTFKVTENEVSNYVINGTEYVQSGKITAKEVK